MITDIKITVLSLYISAPIFSKTNHTPATVIHDTNTKPDIPWRTLARAIGRARLHTTPAEDEEEKPVELPRDAEPQEWPGVLRSLERWTTSRLGGTPS